MRRGRPGAAFVVLVFTLSGCRSAVDLDAARETLRASDRAWARTPPDVERFVAFFAEDGAFLPPDGPIAEGRDEIRKAVAPLMAAPGFSLRWSPEKVEVAASGDFGYTRGTYELILPDASGARVRSRGKYVTVWRKQPDGQWKVVADIFNADGPSSPTAPGPSSSR